MKKLLSALFISAATAGIVSAQTPQPAPKGEPRVFAWSSSEGSGGYLGVQTEEVSKENFSKFGLRDVRGVAIGKVVDGSPAAAAGLQNGDVIVKVNGEEITSSRKLTRLISEISPDHSAKVTVLRNGDQRDVTVTLGKRPMPQFADGNFNFSFPKGFEGFDPKDMPELKDLPRVPMAPLAPGTPDAPQPFVFAFGNRRQIGVGLTALTKQLGDHFGVESGAMVNNVREDSPAAKAGLKAGDIIVDVEGKAVKGEMDVIRAIAEKKEGDITLTFIRDKNRQTIRVTPEEAKGGNNFFEFQRPPSAPDSPAAPGVYRMTVPRAPGSPAIPAMPLNQLMIPGRVI